MSNSGEASFTRRKFTITESLEGVLTSMAEQHYQGNVSLCLRAAIEDHRTTLTGNTEEIVVEQLSRQVNSLQSHQDEIHTLLKSLEDQIDQHPQPASMAANVDTSAMTEEMEAIYAELSNAEDGLRLQGIAERTKYQTSQVQPALGALVDTGYVVTGSDSPRRFYLAGQSRGRRSGGQ